jgi:hypothetical protein
MPGKARVLPYTFEIYARSTFFSQVYASLALLNSLDNIHPSDGKKEWRPGNN